MNIYNKDCMLDLPNYETNYFDVGIVDPPYGIGALNFSSKISKDKRRKIGQNTYIWNKHAPNEQYFFHLNRVCKNTIIWGANYYPNMQGGRIVWYKHNRNPKMSKCEIAYSSFHNTVQYIDIIWQNVNRTEETIHPCQKPVSLYTWLIQTYTKPGEKILDTHLGSGSSAIASDIIGNRHFVGYEIDKEYFARTQRRIERHKQQLKLF